MANVPETEPVIHKAASAFVGQDSSDRVVKVSYSKLRRTENLTICTDFETINRC